MQLNIHVGTHTNMSSSWGNGENFKKENKKDNQVMVSSHSALIKWEEEEEEEEDEEEELYFCLMHCALQKKNSNESCDAWRVPGLLHKVIIGDRGSSSTKI